MTLFITPPTKNTTVQSRSRDRFIFNFVQIKRARRIEGAIGKRRISLENPIQRAKVTHLLSHSRSKWDRAIARLDAATDTPILHFASRFFAHPYYTRINDIKAARNRPVSNAESLSFVVRGLRNPSSPRISHLHLSVSNARFWIGHVHSTPCLYVCTCACGARTYSVCIKRAKDRARAPGACVITVRVRSKVESAEDRLLAFAFHKPLPTMLYNVPLFEWHFAWDPSFCGFAGERGEGLGGWISRKLSSELRIMSGCRAQEMTELSGRGHGTRIFVKTKLILYRVRYGHVCTQFELNFFFF